MPRKPTGKNATVTVAITSAHRDLLRVEAAKRGFTLSAFIECLIEEKTENYTKFDVVKRGTK